MGPWACPHVPCVCSGECSTSHSSSDPCFPARLFCFSKPPLSASPSRNNCSSPVLQPCCHQHPAPVTHRALALGVQKKEAEREGGAQQGALMDFHLPWQRMSAPQVRNSLKLAQKHLPAGSPQPQRASRIYRSCRECHTQGRGAGDRLGLLPTCMKHPDTAVSALLPQPGANNKTKHKREAPQPKKWELL